MFGRLSGVTGGPGSLVSGAGPERPERNMLRRRRDFHRGGEEAIGAELVGCGGRTGGAGPADGSLMSFLPRRSITEGMTTSGTLTRRGFLAGELPNGIRT